MFKITLELKKPRKRPTKLIYFISQFQFAAVALFCLVAPGMAQLINPALQGDLDEIKNLVPSVSGTNFKDLGNKLQGLLPEAGPVVTQGAYAYGGYPYAYGAYGAYPYAYAAPAVVNTKYGKS